MVARRALSFSSDSPLDTTTAPQEPERQLTLPWENWSGTCPRKTASVSLLQFLVIVKDHSTEAERRPAADTSSKTWERPVESVRAAPPEQKEHEQGQRPPQCSGESACSSVGPSFMRQNSSKAVVIIIIS